MDSQQEQKTTPDATATPRPNSLWLVIYECRKDVVVVTPSGEGFFAPGQDAIWPMSAAVWIADVEKMHSELTTAKAEIARLTADRAEWSAIYKRDYGHSWDGRGNYKGF